MKKCTAIKDLNCYCESAPVKKSPPKVNNENKDDSCNCEPRKKPVIKTQTNIDEIVPVSRNFRTSPTQKSVKENNKRDGSFQLKETRENEIKNRNQKPASKKNAKKDGKSSSKPNELSNTVGDVAKLKTGAIDKKSKLQGEKSKMKLKSNTTRSQAKLNNEKSKMKQKLVRDSTELEDENTESKSNIFDEIEKSGMKNDGRKGVQQNKKSELLQKRKKKKSNTKKSKSGSTHIEYKSNICNTMALRSFKEEEKAYQQENNDFQQEIGRPSISSDTSDTCLKACNVLGSLLVPHCPHCKLTVCVCVFFDKCKDHILEIV